MTDYNLNFHDDNILARFFGRSSNYTDIPNTLFKEHNVKKGLRNEDGTGVETIYEPGEEPDVCRISWKEYAENQIVIRHLYTYSFEDGKMKTSRGQNTVFEEVDGIWVETPQVGNHVTTYEFCDDGICVRHIYDGETKELTELYKYYYTPVGNNGVLPLLTPFVSLFDMQVGGIIERTYLYDLTLLEDGTLQDLEDREILERVSPA